MPASVLGLSLNAAEVRRDACTLTERCLVVGQSGDQHGRVFDIQRGTPRPPFCLTRVPKPFLKLTRWVYGTISSGVVFIMNTIFGVSSG